MFKLRGEHIVNEKGKVLDVQGGADRENQNIIVWRLHNRMNQRWAIIYVDKDAPEPKKGELNKEFGLYVERQFMLMTNMRSNRVLDVVGKKVVIKTQNGFATQKWYFHQKTRTVRCVGRPGFSWDIGRSGKSSTLQIWKTNSGWW
jgi:hypothetical protein